MTLPLPEPWVPDAQVQRNFDAISRKLDQPVPQARVYNSANLSTTNATLTVLTFDSERFDEGALHSTSINTGRLTVAVPGLYSIGVNVAWASNATGHRLVWIKNQASTVIATDHRPAVNGDSTRQNLSTLYRLAAGEFVFVEAYQTSGGPLNVEAVGNYSPEFWITRLSGYVGEQYTT